MKAHPKKEKRNLSRYIEFPQSSLFKMSASRSQTSIEFVVKPREDLYLEGSIRVLPRVQKGEGYPCQMQKNQTFSCLFRHYAKHNGLKKEGG